MNNKTTIYTDKAPCYNFLTQAGYNHVKVNHSLGFGSGSFTTNNIESLWAQLKASGKFNKGLNCSTVEEVEAELDVTAWRVKNRQNDLMAILFQTLAKYYNSFGMIIVD
ncbi:hypothetical protein ABPG72_008913 [Tetrahymena utriculariae]